MPTSATGASDIRASARLRGADGRCVARHGARGTTLIELLVVVVIIAILASVASFVALPDPRRAAEQEVERLRTLLELAGEEARRGGRAISWTADAAGYQFEPAVDRRFRRREWPPGLRVGRMELESRQVDPDRRIVFRAGVMPLFRIELIGDDLRIELVSQPAGMVRRAGQAAGT